MPNVVLRWRNYNGSMHEIEIPSFGLIEVPESYVLAEFEAHKYLWKEWWETPPGEEKEILREKYKEARRGFYLGYLYQKNENLL